MIVEETSAAETARAFATYSLVPYLGIFFCPGALILSSVAVLERKPSAGSTIRRFVWLTASVVLLLFQLMLWWFLYKAPQWAQGS